MITIKSAREIETMAAAGRIVAETLALVGRNLRPDITTEELDRLAESFIRSHPGAQPSFKGLYDFPATLCTSINQEIVHGIPSHKRVLHDGDILSVDVGVRLEGLHADSAATFPVGDVTADAARLLQVTQEALAAVESSYVLRRAVRGIDRKPRMMAAMVSAISSLDPGAVACQHDLDATMERIIRRAIGEPEPAEVADIIRILEHVWFSSLLSWMNGRSDVQNMGSELEIAARLLLRGSDGARRRGRSA